MCDSGVHNRCNLPAEAIRKPLDLIRHVPAHRDVPHGAMAVSASNNDRNRGKQRMRSVRLSCGCRKNRTMVGSDLPDRD
jgi:hypothetical protein